MKKYLLFLTILGASYAAIAQKAPPASVADKKAPVADKKAPVADKKTSVAAQKTKPASVAGQKATESETAIAQLHLYISQDPQGYIKKIQDLRTKIEQQIKQFEKDNKTELNSLNPWASIEYSEAHTMTQQIEDEETALEAKFHDLVYDRLKSLIYTQKTLHNIPESKKYSFDAPNLLAPYMAPYLSQTSWLMDITTSLILYTLLREYVSKIMETLRTDFS